MRLTVNIGVGQVQSDPIFSKLAFLLDIHNILSPTLSQLSTPPHVSRRNQFVYGFYKDRRGRRRDIIVAILEEFCVDKCVYGIFCTDKYVF